MKKILYLLMAVAAMGAPVTGLAQAGNATATVVSGVISSIRGTSNPQERQSLVQNAIRSNPQLAAQLVAALIAEFPTEAATFTKAVVDAIVALPPSVSVEVKSTILTEVAQASVNAALSIPQGRVDSVLETVNAVKAELASITDTTLAAAVQQYTVPITSESALLAAQAELNSQNPENDNRNIISGDTVAQ